MIQKKIWFLRWKKEKIYRRGFLLPRNYYKSIVSVYCPVLGDTVYFTSEGFNHLLYKSHFRPRSINERYLKLMCLKYATKVIGKCSAVSKTRLIGKITLLELVYKVEPEKKIRVIIKKEGAGKYKFLSIMPHDKKSKKAQKNA